MADVIDLNAHRKYPHLQGTARCHSCGHEWEAVAPVGTFYLDCPKCEGNHGRFKRCVSYADEFHYTCQCGSEEFCVTPGFIYCPHCGVKRDLESLKT